MGILSNHLHLRSAAISSRRATEPCSAARLQTFRARRDLEKSGRRRMVRLSSVVHPGGPLYDPLPSDQKRRRNRREPVRHRAGSCLE